MYVTCVCVCMLRVRVRVCMYVMIVFGEGGGEMHGCLLWTRMSRAQHAHTETYLKQSTGMGGKMMGAITVAIATAPGCRKRSNLCLFPLV